MGSITIHAIDAALDQRLTDEARRRHTSKNALVKELLAQSLGLPVGAGYADDYREFCGFWTAAEAQAFYAAQESNSIIDAGDWS